MNSIKNNVLKLMVFVFCFFVTNTALAGNPGDPCTSDLDCPNGCNQSGVCNQLTNSSPCSPDTSGAPPCDDRPGDGDVCLFNRCFQKRDSCVFCSSFDNLCKSGSCNDSTRVCEAETGQLCKSGSTQCGCLNSNETCGGQNVCSEPIAGEGDSCLNSNDCVLDPVYGDRFNCLFINGNGTCGRGEGDQCDSVNQCHPHLYSCNSYGLCTYGDRGDSCNDFETDCDPNSCGTLVGNDEEFEKCVSICNSDNVCAVELTIEESQQFFCRNDVGYSCLNVDGGIQTECLNFECVCTDNCPARSECTDSSQCVSGVCNELGLCDASTGEACDDWRYLGGDHQQGQDVIIECANLNDRCETTPSNDPGLPDTSVCVTKDPGEAGHSCSAHNECNSNSCSDENGMLGPESKCQDRVSGSYCESNGRCESGKCVENKCVEGSSNTSISPPLSCTFSEYQGGRIGFLEFPSETDDLLHCAQGTGIERDVILQGTCINSNTGEECTTVGQNMCNSGGTQSKCELEGNGCVPLYPQSPNLFGVCDNVDCLLSNGDNDCPSGETCLEVVNDSDVGLCSGALNCYENSGTCDNKFCEYNSQCESNNCSASGSNICLPDPCVSNSMCLSGNCAKLSEESPVGECSAGLLGQPCDQNGDCLNGRCAYSQCVGGLDCESPEQCKSGVTFDVEHSCVNNGHCDSSICLNNICQNKEVGSLCKSNGGCNASFCVITTETEALYGDDVGICSDGSECSVCNKQNDCELIETGKGVCRATSVAPNDKRCWNGTPGDPCSNDNECVSENCINGTCDGELESQCALCVNLEDPDVSHMCNMDNIVSSGTTKNVLDSIVTQQNILTFGCEDVSELVTNIQEGSVISGVNGPVTNTTSERWRVIRDGSVSEPFRLDNFQWSTSTRPRVSYSSSNGITFNRDTIGQNVVCDTPTVINPGDPGSTNDTPVSGVDVWTPDLNDDGSGLIIRSSLVNTGNWSASGAINQFVSFEELIAVSCLPGGYVGYSLDNGRVTTDVQVAASYNHTEDTTLTTRDGLSSSNKRYTVVSNSSDIVLEVLWKEGEGVLGNAGVPVSARINTPGLNNVLNSRNTIRLLNFGFFRERIRTLGGSRDTLYNLTNEPQPLEIPYLESMEINYDQDTMPTNWCVSL